jgi:hypothetical protein
MVKKHKGERLWRTDTDSLSGAEMIYGIELPREVKEKYKKNNLNEKSKLDIEKS